jgi:excisionase family DNA binding protein
VEEAHGNVAPQPFYASAEVDGSVPQLPQLLRLEEVAKALGTTEWYLRRLVAERRIPFIKVGYFVRFDPADVSRWLTAHRVKVVKHRP